jgi:hypothetical protein
MLVRAEVLAPLDGFIVVFPQAAILVQVSQSS